MQIHPQEPRFQYVCQRCGNCCRWPGDVQLTGQDITEIAGFLGMDEQDFIQAHTRLRRSRNGLSLEENADGSCIFLDGHNHCRINPVKPAQCSAFPNRWRFPGWRALCDATPEPAGVRET